MQYPRSSHSPTKSVLDGFAASQPVPHLTVAKAIIARIRSVKTCPVVQEKQAVRFRPACRVEMLLR
jgi:hypothetical protein